jgi:hypothetical protein
MPLAIAATVVCGVLLLGGPDRRSPRAWVALGVMLAAMLAALAGSTAQLIAGAVALLSAPAVVARVPRAGALSSLHRAAALLATAGCLLGAGHGIPSSHHAGLPLGAVLLAGYLASAALAIATLRGRKAPLSPAHEGPLRPLAAMVGEVGVMAAGVFAMALLD